MEIILIRLLFPFLNLSLLVIFVSQFAFLSLSSSHLCPLEQNHALLQFKKIISLNNCSDQDYFHRVPRKIISWKEGTDCCFWDGVSCDDDTGNVIGLDLQHCMLSGTINPDNTLFLLSHLRWLNLAGNDFCASEIPSTISQLQSLTHLNLSGADFVGVVPQEISQLSKLVSLDLSGSYGYLYIENPTMKRLVQNMTGLRELVLSGVHMSGVAPQSLTNLSSSLVSLDLEGCLLGNGEEFPVHIFQLPNLHSVRLTENRVSVRFPKSNWTSPLKYLDVHFSGSFVELPNSILGLKFLEYLCVDGRGKLPDSIGSLESLKSLILFGSFTGSIPASIGNLTQITDIYLSGENFTGELPFSLGKLEHLTSLTLVATNFIGQIPNAFTNLTELLEINLKSNHFSHQLPSSLFNLTRLVSVDFSNNHLTGPIPASCFSSHSSLVSLDISHNLLTGSISSSLFSIPSLEYLDLSDNKLDGYIDDFQVNKSHLVVIDLSNNKLHGPIPRSVFGLGHLTILRLTSNNITGFLDLEMISKLKNLTTLDLSCNSLSLSLPSRSQNISFPMFDFVNLSSCNLREIPIILKDSKYVTSIDLSRNKIQGLVPEWFWGLGEHSLEYLYLAHNFLTSFRRLPWKMLSVLDLRSNLFQGPLPDTVYWPQDVLLSNNKFTGEIPLSICNMSSMGILDLSNNSLTGVIPQCLVNLSGPLMVLDLRMNNFHGVIPENFAMCEALRTLGLNGNQFEGTLPHSLLNCKHLEVLDVGNNKICGQFPHWLGTLPELRVLILRSNKFHGAIVISKTEARFPMLRILDISHNGFTGSLPTRFFKNLKAMWSVGRNELRDVRYLGSENGYYKDDVKITMKGLDMPLERILTILTTIDVSNNNFSGKIPSSIGMLMALKGLNFSHNKLVGCIPSSIGSLTNLEWLDLSSNQLTRSIPQKLLDLIFLEVLNLSYNKLEGPIPLGKQFSTFSNESYLGNSRLCGFPLSKKCNQSETGQPPAPSFAPSSSKIDFGWEVVALGYGCGVIFGLIVGYIVFSTGKPQWLVMMVEGFQLRKLKRSRAGARRHRRGN